MPFADHGGFGNQLYRNSFREGLPRAVEGMGVIDEAVLVAVLAGQHAGTAGATDGVGYEAIGETYALVCDAVDVGGLDVSLVVGADGLEGVIVRHDIKDIHGLGGLPGRILFLATGGGGYRRQTCQNE